MNTMVTTRQLPVVLQLEEMAATPFIAYYSSARRDIEEVLRINGAIKFKGLSIDSPGCFKDIIDGISDGFLPYVDGNSPRIKLSGNVYTSTEYDKTQRITMHNELSYSAKWPGRLFFSCLQPAETGGETLLADSRDVLAAMDSTIVEEIRAKGILYIRNLHGGRGIGPSWQDTFETDSKEQVDDYCRALGMDHEWNGDLLRLRQPSKGIIRHRLTGEEVWFNQIDQFHPCHLDRELFETLSIMYEDASSFPMFVKFGDGTAIPESYVREVLRVTDALTMAPVWGKNELLIIDNELVSHGRNSYTGDRRVLVAMSA